MNYLLDTSVVVGYLRDKAGKRQLMKDLFVKGDLRVSLVTYGELEYGAVKSRNYNEEKLKISGCFDDLEVEVLILTKETMGLFAKVKSGLERKGETLDDFDLLIGATAMENELVLVTDNEKHFARFPGLKVYEEEVPT